MAYIFYHKIEKLKKKSTTDLWKLIFTFSLQFASSTVLYANVVSPFTLYLPFSYNIVREEKNMANFVLLIHSQIVVSYDPSQS